MGHDRSHRPGQDGHHDDHDYAHRGLPSSIHTHGMVDPSIVSTERGVWALKWSFVGLMVTALFRAAEVRHQIDLPVHAHD